MTKLKRVWAWIVYSSANPKQKSLALKAMLTGGVTALIAVSNLLHVQLPSEDLTNAVNAIVAFVELSLITLASAIAAFGWLRKIWFSVSGDNRVINEHEAFNG